MKIKVLLFILMVGAFVSPIDLNSRVSENSESSNSTKSQKLDFRVSLSVIFADGMFEQGFSYEDGKRKAENVEDLQKMFKAHGSTEVYARISTRMESHNKGLERAKLAKKLGLSFNPEIGLFGTYSDVRWQYEPDFTDFPELGVPGEWSSLTLEQMQTVLFDYGKLLARDILNTGAEVIIWDLGNEVEYGVAGITINTGQGDKYRAPDAVDQAIGKMSKDEFFKMPHPDKISWLQKHIWPYEAKLFKAVSDGIRSVDPDARFSTHLSGVAAVDRKISVAFFKAMNSGGYFPDELGLSYYPTGGGGQRDRLKLFKENVISLEKELGRQVFIAEYGYPAGTMSGIFSWNNEIDGFPLSEEGQADFTRELVSWGSSTGLISGIRPWGPDLLHWGWLPMSFFNLKEKKATARKGLDAIQAGLKEARNLK